MRVYKITGCLLIIITLLWAVLQGGAAYYASTLTQLPVWIAQKIPYEIKSGSTHLAWENWGPALVLSQVDLKSPEHNTRLQVDKLSLNMNAWRYLFGQLQFDKVVIIGARASLDQNTVKGFAEQLRQDSASPKFRIKKLFVQDSEIDLQTEKGKLSLSAIDLNLVSTTTYLKIRGAALTPFSANMIHIAVDVPLIKFQDYQVSVMCDQLSLTALQDFLPQEIPMGFKQGQVDLKADWQGKSWEAYRLKAQFKAQEVQADVVAAKINELSGELEYNGHQGSVLLQSDRLCIEASRFFLNPVTLDKFSSKITFNNNPQDKLIHIHSLTGSLAGALLKTQGTLRFFPQRKYPEVDLNTTLGDMAIPDLKNYLPVKKMDSDLVQWLDKSLGKGLLQETHCILKGDLAQFPFDSSPDRSPGSEDIFQVRTQLKGADFNYAAPWPALSDMRATLLFHNRKMEVLAEQAIILNQTQEVLGTLMQAKAVIPDLGAGLLDLSVQTQIKTTLEAGMAVVQNSPLPAAVKSSLAPLGLTGEMALDLSLGIPLGNKAGLTTTGVIKMDKARFQYSPWQIDVPDLSGEVVFTQDSINAEKLQGKFLESPIGIEIRSDFNSTLPQLQIKANSRLNLAKLQSRWPDFHNNALVTGEAAYQLGLTVSMRPNLSHFSVQLTSDLVGVAVQAPFPLAKTSEEAKLLDLSFYIEPDALIRVSSRYGANGEGMDLAYSTERKNNVWQSLGGHLCVGTKDLAKFREDKILFIEGSLPELDFAQWKGFLSALPIAHREGGSFLSPWLKLSVDNLKVQGYSPGKTLIEAKWAPASPQWHIQLQGPSISGEISLPAPQEKQDIVVNLQKLWLTSVPSETTPVDGLSQGPQKTPLTQAIDLRIQDLRVDKKNVQNISARIEPAWKGVFFPTVKGRLKSTEFELTGSWDHLTVDKQFSVMGKMTTQNFNDTFQALGMPNPVGSAEGFVGFSLRWQGVPFKIHVPTLAGYAEFSLKNGVIQGVNPGLGRVLSLLNVNTVQRRLNFDFRDLGKSGFVFDELEAKFQFGKGKVISNKVSLQGPAANIEAFGQADLASYGLQGEMVVMPNVTGSLPLAAAIAAGNPAIGAAVWVADKMFGKSIQAIHRYRYKLAGTWKAPVVEDMSVGLSRRIRGES